MGEQAANGGLLGRNRHINLAALNQVHIVGVVDQGEYFAGAQTLGQQRRHDIGFVIVGNCDEHIGILNVFFQQNVFVCSIAFEHNRFAQAFGKQHTALVVAFKQLYLITVFQGVG